MTSKKKAMPRKDYSKFFLAFNKTEKTSKELSLLFKRSESRSSNAEICAYNTVSLSAFDINNNCVDDSNGLLGYFNNVLCLTIGGINLLSILSNLGISYNAVLSITLELEGSFSPFYGEVDVYDYNGYYVNTIDWSDGINPLEIDIKEIYDQSNNGSFVLEPVVPCSGCTLLSPTNAVLRIVYKQLDYLIIDTSPNKTTYIEGEFFDPTGMVLKAYYSDGSSETINNYSYSPNAALTINNNQITISYQTQSVNQSIVVNAVSLNLLENVIYHDNRVFDKYKDYLNFNVKDYYFRYGEIIAFRR